MHLLSHFAEKMLGFFESHPYVGPSLLLAAGLRIYYQLVVVRKIKLDCKKGTKFEVCVHGSLIWNYLYHGVVSFQAFLKGRLPILQEEYKPTFWCFEPRCQTIIAHIMRMTLPDIKYRREVS